MKKRRKFWILIIPALICAISVCVLAQKTISEKMRLLGQIDRQNSNQTDSYSNAAAYVGEHTVINKSDLDRFTKRVALTVDDPQEAKEIALKAVAIREIFAYRAEEAGLPNSDEEFLSWFDSYEASLKSTDNYDDVLAYIDGMGMTEDEYWEWARTDPAIRHEWYSNLFVETLKSDFASQCSAEKGTEEYNAEWNEFFSAYKEEAYESENFHRK